MVYCAFSDGTVTAFDARSGQERWAPVDLSAATEQLLGEVPTYLDVDTTPVADVVGGQPVVYVASYEGGVFALNADNGTRVWTNELARGTTELAIWQQPAHLPRGGGPEVAGRKLLMVSSGTTGLWALDPETGTEVWRRPLPEGGTSEVVPMLGALLFSTTQQGLFLVSPLDGKIIDGIHTGEGFSMPPAAYGQRAFIVSNAGRLYSLHVTPPI
jgi:outer membrane protein assembly factor BamB